jgi:uncharacterized membrane protein
MTLESSKNLGGIGAILLVISALGFFGTPYAGVLVLVGIILTLIGTKGLADHYNDGGIFNNALYGFIMIIIGGVAFVSVLVMTIISAIAQLGITDWTGWMTEIQQNAVDVNALWNLIGPIVVGFAVALIVLFICVVIASILYRKSLSSLAKKSGVGMFETAGLLMLIGAVLTIVLVGFILIWIAFILVAVAFFSIKTTPTQPPPTTPPPS